jgi:hypothetical protein
LATSGGLGCTRIGEPLEQLVSLPIDLGQHLRRGLRKIAVNEVLQPANVAPDRHKKAIGRASLPDLGPSGSEDARPLPDETRQHKERDRIQQRDRKDPPADRNRPQQGSTFDGLRSDAGRRPEAV